MCTRPPSACIIAPRFRCLTRGRPGLRLGAWMKSGTDGGGWGGPGLAMRAMSRHTILCRVGSHQTSMRTGKKYSCESADSMQAQGWVLKMHPQSEYPRTSPKARLVEAHSA